MKVKKIVATLGASMLLSTSIYNIVPNTKILASTEVSATTLSNTSSLSTSIKNNEDDKPEYSVHLVYANDKYKKFNMEIQELLKKGLSEQEFKQKANDLIIAYDGADATYNVVPNNTNPLFSSKLVRSPDVREQFVNGGVNAMGYSRNGLELLRSAYYQQALVLQGGATVTGVGVGASVGPLGSLAMGGLGFVTGAMLATRYNQGADIFYKLIGKGFTSGGARMTLTESFPINSVNSQSQWVNPDLY